MIGVSQLCYCYVLKNEIDKKNRVTSLVHNNCAMPW